MANVKTTKRAWTQLVNKNDPKRRVRKEPAYQFSNGRVFYQNPNGGAYGS